MTTPPSEFTADLLRAQANLPDDATLVVYGAGKVRHVVGDERKGHTWCGMFYQASMLRPADPVEDVTKPICGACLRTLPAVIVRRNGAKS